MVFRFQRCTDRAQLRRGRRWRGIKYVKSAIFEACALSGVRQPNLEHKLGYSLEAVAFWYHISYCSNEALRRDLVDG